MSDQLENSVLSTEVIINNLNSILSSSDRDFLVRNNGDQVKVENLRGKKLGLYFSASWCGPCQKFTPKLVDTYNELLPEGEFEVVFVSGDEDGESFDSYFSKMPWLAVPFSDSETRERLDELFSVRGIPHLVIIDENGKVLTDDGVKIIREYGAEGFPFSVERIKVLKEHEEVGRREQSLKSLLTSNSRDYVVASDGNKVSVTEFEGKTIGLYFYLSTFYGSTAFTPKLIQIYEKLKEKGEKFEIVMIPLDDDDDEESFNLVFKDMPWYSLPIKDKNCEKLLRYFELFTLPTLVIIGPDGKTLHSNVAEAIEEHGDQAFPFTPEKFAELEEIEKAKWEAQTLDSILILGEQDFVIGKAGAKIRVSDLVGKNILLYFSAHWCPPCRAFLPKLIDAYHKIKAKDDTFEVIFISSDRDQSSFDEFFSKMPWLAIPFGDERKESLSRIFKVQGIPMLVAIGPTGKTVSTEAKNLLLFHGADAYPFTNERLEEIEAEYEEMAKGWPQKVKHSLHEEHELLLTKGEFYTCDSCYEDGQVWSFSCEECNIYLHPKCALEKLKEDTENGTNAEVAEPKDGWVCDGEVCYKARD